MKTMRRSTEREREDDGLACSCDRGATGSVFLTLISFVVVLSVVVFIHEFGHFWVGRLCGVGVTAFSIGFGKELFGWTDRHGTRWKISAIPLGGYVKFVGDLNAASVPDQSQLAADVGEPSGRSVFPTKASPSGPPSWRRARSPISSSPSRSSRASTISAAARSSSRASRRFSPAAPPRRPGFLPKDLILTIDGRRIETFADMQLLVSSSAGEPLAFTVDRAGRPWP